MMKENNDYKPAFLMVGNISYLWTIADGYIKAVKELEKIKGGMDQNTASMQVMQKYETELRKLA